MSKPVIDISYWQTPSLINYDKLAEEVDGAILRAVYGITKDTHFETHYREFTKRKVRVGAYHYIVGAFPMSAQAEVFKDAIAKKTLEELTWMDVEDTRVNTKLNRKNVLDYAALVPEAGIYTSYYKWQEIMKLAAKETLLTDRLMWVANWDANKPLLPQGWDTYYLWQHTDKGRLNGYSGNLDLNKRGTAIPVPIPVPDPTVFFEMENEDYQLVIYKKDK